jgi:hypothetical protein
MSDGKLKVTRVSLRKSNLYEQGYACVCLVNSRELLKFHVSFYCFTYMTNLPKAPYSDVCLCVSSDAYVPSFRRSNYALKRWNFFTTAVEICQVECIKVSKVAFLSRELLLLAGIDHLRNLCLEL